jgi:restriction endonuclease S subunit
MAIISQILYSEIEERLDAEYYRPEFLQVVKELQKLRNSPTFKIKTLADVSVKIRKGIFYILKSEYKESGVPFIRVSDIKDLTIDSSNIAYISEEKNVKEVKTCLHPGDIVISKSGTLGNVAMIPGDIPQCNISQDIIGLSLSNDVKPEYVTSFLASKYGKLQLIRGRSQIVQAHLALEHIRKLIIPIPDFDFQERISKTINEAYSKRRKATKLYSEAETLLFRLLGIQKYGLQKKSIYEVKSSDVFESRRFDAEYFKPEYGQIIQLLKNSGYELKKLNEVIEISNEIIEPRKEPEKKFKYIELANVNSTTGEVTDCDEVIGYLAPSRAKMLVKKGDILVPSLSGSLDNVGLVPDELDNSVASTGFYVIRSKLFFSEFLFLLFRSPLIKKQLEQKVAGTIMAAIDRKAFQNILIPKIPKSNQLEACAAIKEYFKLLRERKEFIRRAIHEVEELIKSTTVKFSEV